MSTRHQVVAFLVVVVVAMPAAIAHDSGSSIDPKAIEILKKMNGYVQSLDAFELKAETIADVRLEAGLIAEQMGEVRARVQRPNRLRAKMDGEEKRNEMFLADGQLTLHTHDKGYYAQVEVPEGIEAGMDYALNEFGIEAPLADLIHSNIAEQFLEGVERAYHLGVGRVRGVECDQIALRFEDADVQIWVSTGDKPLPRRVVITSIWEGGAPRFAALLDWNTTVTFDDATFTFKAPPDSMRIDFQRSSQ